MSLHYVQYIHTLKAHNKMVIRCKHNFFMYIVYIIKSQNTLLTFEEKGKVGKT